MYRIYVVYTNQAQRIISIFFNFPVDSIVKSLNLNFHNDIIFFINLRLMEILFFESKYTYNNVIYDNEVLGKQTGWLNGLSQKTDYYFVVEFNLLVA